MTDAALDRVVHALDAAGLLVARHGALPASVTAVADDTRRLQPGALFVAVKGGTSDGHDFLGAAVERGATVAIVEDASRTELPALVVRDGRRAAAVAAAAFHGDPARALRLIAVTGTNGKTTTVGLLRHLFDAPAERAASIGTLGVLVGSAGTEFPGGGGLTTPGPVELQRVLRALVDAGVHNVVMEVSSHALEQRRVDGVRFAAGVFTNLTHDHLDYHGTMESYFASKARLIEYIAVDGVAVTNADDRAWDTLPAGRRRVTFGVTGPGADVAARDVRFLARGSVWRVSAGGDSAPVALPLIGDFNVANGLAAAATAVALGHPLSTVAARLASAPQVPGRLELLHERPTVLRDYAHTPDALERALAAVRPFTAGRLIVVFGCGGDRDRGKRPVMGAIAEHGADVVILTSDNPRTEDPERILDDIEGGMTGARHLRIEDRRGAIAAALDVATPDDVIVLAGKGHETYQVRGTTRHPFDEKDVVAALTGATA